MLCRQNRKGHILPITHCLLFTKTQLKVIYFSQEQNNLSSFSQAPTFERVYDRKSSLQPVQLHAFLCCVFRAMILIFNDSSTCDTILFIQIHHAELKRVLLPSFPETTEDKSTWHYSFNVLVCALYKLTFCSIYPQEKPFQMLDRNNTETWKKINLMLQSQTICVYF